MGISGLTHELVLGGFASDYPPVSIAGTNESAGDARVRELRLARTRGHCTGCVTIVRGYVGAVLAIVAAHVSAITLTS
jgi:hypothetical protein